ncbi:MAG: ABC transporter substrate-binding protein [Chloroflexi bacterium]|nr:ABC transporter substrate-binding protein [Chloroflexota bacterium]
MKTGKCFAICLTAFGLLLASCAPAAAPATPAAKPTTAAKPTAAPAAAPTKPAAAATPAPKATAAAPAATPKPAAQPKRGGILNRSIRSDTPHYDIHLATSSIYLHPISPTYNGLVQYDPFQAGRVVPDLAEKWTIGSDGLTYTFNLLKGVKWHDGVAFTSADVPPSIARLKKHPTAGPGLVPIKTVETPDDATVKVTLSYPSAAMINYLALAWSAILPKHILDKKGDMKQDVVGSGAFKFKRHERGSFLELERNPNHFQPGKPYLDGIRTFPIADESTSLAALKTKRIDFMVFISDQGAMNVRETFKEGTAGQFRKGQWRSLYLPMDKAPWTDIRVRKAINLVTDRQAAIKVIMSGMAEIDGIIPESMGGMPVAELLKRPGYRQPKDQDIAEAKKLMEEAGFARGLKTSTLYRRGSEYESQAVFMKDQLKALGIDMELKTVDDATFYDLRDKRAYETFSHRRPMAVVEPDDILMKEWKSGAPDNWGNVKDPELDKMIDAQSREQDPAKRKAMVRQISEKIEDMYVETKLLWGGYWRAWGPQVKDYVLGGQLYDAEKFAEVWLDR